MRDLATYPSTFLTYLYLISSVASIHCVIHLCTALGGVGHGHDLLVPLADGVPGVVAVGEDPDAVVVEVGAGHVVAGVSHRAVLAPVGVEDGRAVRPLELQVLVQVLEPDPVPLRLPGCQFN